MVVAVAKAIEAGATGDRLRLDREHRRFGVGVCGARAGLSAVVLCPAGAIAAAKHGAVARSRCARSRGARELRRGAPSSASELAGRGGFALVNSLNPYRIEGQKTAAFEIDEELGRAPDVLALPYGGGGNTLRLREGVRRGRGPRRGSSPRRQRSAPTRSPRRSGSPSRLTRPRSTTWSHDGATEIVTVSDEEIRAPGSSSQVSKGSSASPPRPPESLRSRTSSSSPGRLSSAFSPATA